MGTWIETIVFVYDVIALMSFPSWERGLKRRVPDLLTLPADVVPLVGTWIETLASPVPLPRCPVVPLVGTWIETGF